jgi:ABC-2 type transport system ATP-binding protein
MSDYAIQTRQLTRDFGAIRAVDDVTLDVAPGIVFGFLGANGAGKTTTIHLLLGLIEPTAGSARTLGFDTRQQGQQVRERTGALLEYNGLYERLSAVDNLDFYGRIWHMPVAERQARIQELLTHFGLWDRRSERVATWSRGMKQKLAIARVLLHHPQLIFLDEPTAGLDPVAAASLRDDLDALARREGVTVFLNTHNLDEAQRLCTQVGVIRAGKLLAVGSPDELRANTNAPRLEITGEGFTEAALAAARAAPGVALVEFQPAARRTTGADGAGNTDGQVFVELEAEARGAPVVSALVGAGARIEEARRDRATLEKVFLSLMEEEK